MKYGMIFCGEHSNSFLSFEQLRKRWRFLLVSTIFCTISNSVWEEWQIIPELGVWILMIKPHWKNCLHDPLRFHDSSVSVLRTSKATVDFVSSSNHSKRCRDLRCGGLTLLPPRTLAGVRRRLMNIQNSENILRKSCTIEKYKWLCAVSSNENNAYT